ncbi:hypothetical protein SAMD00079811_35860 [Scytonema sp. HK-05]|nr:hypothetical protein SAMD00079811_35860 [Scytonema sp. HK-05]
MTATLPVAQSTQPFYASADGEPLAETYDHLYALLTTLEVLKQYLAGRQATVLANQFLYYAQGFPKLPVAASLKPEKLRCLITKRVGERANVRVACPEDTLGAKMPKRRFL